MPLFCKFCNTLFKVFRLFFVFSQTETRYFTKVVVQTLQFLDKRPAEEPMPAINEDPGEYGE